MNSVGHAGEARAHWRAGTGRRPPLAAWLAVALCAVATGGVVAGPVAAQAQSSAPRGPSFAVRAKAIYPVTRTQPGPVENAILIVRGGKIVSVTRGMAAPPDLPLIDLPDAYICPGFVSAASSLVPQHGGDQTVSGAYRAVEGFDAFADNQITLANGVTTVHLDPGGHRLVSGVGAIAKVAGPSENRVLNPAASICVNLDAYDPPGLVDVPFYASSDVGITPATQQRPRSRLGRFLELNERIRNAAVSMLQSGSFDFHNAAFASAWRDELPVRLQVRRAADIGAAITFLRDLKRNGYLVGAAEADSVVAELIAARLPVVLRLEREFRFVGGDIGPDPAAPRDDLRVAGALDRPELRVALAGRSGIDQPQMIGLMALRGGMTEGQTLASLTRIPAEILGVADRVGSLEPGKDADFVVLSAPPLAVGSSVLASYVDGVRVFAAPDERSNAVVVRGGTLWLGDGHTLRDGSLLIVDGKIQAVGQRVATPPFARIIDAGPQAFITPGFIDAHSHLGLGGDRMVVGPEVPIDQTVGVATREFLRVAHAGVTTVLLTGYRTGGGGARMAAVKTSGSDPGSRVARAIAGLRLDYSEQDPLSSIDGLKQLIERGRKYVESWKQYREALAKWEADKAAGRATEVRKSGDEPTVEEKKVDPITGTWDFKISGGPLPETIEGTLRLRLTGNKIEGRAAVPMSDEEAVLTGTLEGDTVRMEFEADEELPIGTPAIEAKLDREDHMQGKFKIGTAVELEFEATRTSKAAVEFKVTRKKKSKDGRPTPPRIDDALEPVRAVIEGRAPLVVEVREAAQAEAIAKLVIDENKLPLVLLGAENLADMGDGLAARKDQLGVIVPSAVMRLRDRKLYHQAADLAARGVRFAFGSDAEDAARNLPLVTLFSVQKGLGGDDALRALTSDAARLFKIDDRVGSLTPGRDGDVLIFTGHPFDAGSRLERVLVNGEEPPPLEDAP